MDSLRIIPEGSAVSILLQRLLDDGRKKKETLGDMMGSKLDIHDWL